MTLPVELAFYMPVPELTAWYTQERAVQQQGIPRQHRPPTPPSNYPTTQAPALRPLQQCKEQYPDLKVSCIIADALYGTATFMDGASTLSYGVQVVSQLRSNQNVFVYQLEQPVVAYFATHPGAP
jgi:hypothetical protein